MSDIARLSGVSKSTVSRALADSPLVNQQTKDLVMQIANENNYRPNIAARNFRLKETLTIAVILVGEEDADWRISDPFFLELLGSIAEAIDDHGHQLLVTKTSPQPMSWVQDFVNRRQADGVILIGQSSQHEAIDELAKIYRGISVWGAQVDDNYTYPVVGTNNKLGGYRATKHLIDKGRKNLIFLGYKDVPEVNQRYEGFCQALDEAGIPINKDQIAYWENVGNTDYIQSEFKRMLDDGESFDGIVTISDMLAISVIHSLQAIGLKVPEQVSVVGYDDVGIASYYNPPLTTVHQNRSVGAKVLVDNLLEALDGHKPEMITLDPQLVIRGSS